MKKKHIFLTSFIALLSVMSLMICSVYRNDQIQELGRSGKQAVIWYLENDIQESVLGLAQTIRPKDMVKHYPMGPKDKSDKIDSAKIADFLYRYDGTECVKPYKKMCIRDRVKPSTGRMLILR